MDLTDGYGATLDRKDVCYDADASAVVMITDVCPCSYPDNSYSNKRWCCGEGAARAGHTAGGGRSHSCSGHPPEGSGHPPEGRFDGATLHAAAAAPPLQVITSTLT
jgi:hypothetical protein